MTQTIGIGINENIVLAKAEITEAEKGTLAFTWRPVVIKTDEPELSNFQKLAQDGYAETSGDGALTIRLFSPLPPFAETKDGKAVTPAEQQDRASRSIAEIRNVLFQILTIYVTVDKAKFDMYRNTGIVDDASYNALIIGKDTLNKIMFNMSEDFVRIITPYLDKDEYAVRLLLLRQSKLKNYADFRQKFVKDNPFIESMKIPKAASKVHFTKRELSDKMDSTEATGISAADQAAEASESQTAADIFGKQDDEPDYAPPTTAVTAIDDLPF